MATGKLGIDEGTTSNLATYTFTEDAVTKHAGRSVIAKADGTDADIATSAKQDTGNTSLASIDGKLAAGHGTAAAAVRVELPTDGTGVIATVGAVTAISNALPAGTNAIGKLAANSGVDIGDVDVTTVTPGTAATNLGKAEDAAHSSGDVGVMSLGVRNDTMSALTSTDGDYSPISVTSTGRLLTTPAPSAAMVRGNASVAGTGDTSLVAASGSGSLKTYITNLSFANTGSSTTLITVKDGSGGSTLFYTIAPAGGGSNIELDIPIVTTANTALYFACGTSSTTVYASATGYLAP